MKKRSKILIWTLLILYFPTIMAFVSIKNSTLICSNVVVNVTDSVKAQFVNGREIRNIIIKRFPNVIGTLIKDIDYEAIETSIEKHPAVKTCQVFNNAFGELNVKIVQHAPIIRVFSGNKSYYLDDNGTIIPVSGRFSAKVLVVNGNIPNNKDDLLKVARFIVDNSFWNAQMEQIYIRRNDDYILVPRVGDHLILLGSSERLEEKFNNLMLLYRELNPKEWNKYRAINLKFKGQVICSANRNF